MELDRRRERGSRSPGLMRFPGLWRRRRPHIEVLEDRTLLSTFTVTNTADSGSGSLRYEINQADSAGGANTIAFSSLFNTPQTITLTSGQLTLSDTTGTETIEGPTVGVTISGDNASRVFLVDSGV